MENTKVDVYQSPPPTPFFGEVKRRETWVALWQLEISVCFLGDEGKWKDSVRIYVFLSLNLLLSTNHQKHAIFALFFDADTCWQEIVMCCLPPFPVVGPGFSPTLPTAHLIQIPSQKSKDKSVHQQHQQHLSHGRVVNGLVDVGPSHSWNRKQKTHEIWRCGRHQSFRWRYWFPKIPSGIDDIVIYRGHHIFCLEIRLHPNKLHLTLHLLPGFLHAFNLQR